MVSARRRRGRPEAVGAEAEGEAGGGGGAAEVGGRRGRRRGDRRLGGIGAEAEGEAGGGEGVAKAGGGRRSRRRLVVGLATSVHPPLLCGLYSPSSEHAFQPHGAHAAIVVLARDILHFERTSQVAEGLSRHVVSSKKAQANWYKKLLVAWKKARPTLRTPEDVARLVVQTLKNHQKANVEGFLAFYGLD